MKKSLIVSASILAIIAAITLSACGHHRHHDPEKKAEWIVEEISDHLDLNENQAAKLSDVKTALLTHRKQFHENKTEIMDQMIVELQKPEMDKTFLLSVIDQKQDIFNQMAPEVINKLVAFHASLDDEQKQEIIEKMQKHHKYHH